jgi:hypothetical protein
MKRIRVNIYIFHSISMRKLLLKFRTLCQIIIIHKEFDNIIIKKLLIF